MSDQYVEASKKARTAVLDDANLLSYINNLEDMAIALDAVTKGESTFAQSCRKLGLNPSKVRNLLKTKTFLNIRDTEDELPLEDVTAKLFDGYDLIYAHVFGIDPLDVKLPEDYRETVDTVLSSKVFTDQERQVIREKYCLDKYDDESYTPISFVEMGKEHGVTAERMRQVYAKAMSKFQYSGIRNRLRVGNKKYDNRL